MISAIGPALQVELTEAAVGPGVGSEEVDLVKAVLRVVHKAQRGGYLLDWARH